MDTATAKTLVSSALVVAIALFSAVSLQALFAQVAADLRAAQGQRLRALRVPVRVRRDGRSG